MLGRLFRNRTPRPLPEAELARRLIAEDHRCACCGTVWDAAHAVRVRPFGWPNPPAPAPDDAFEGPGDIITERYARRGRDLLARALLPIAVRGTQGHVFLGVWANLSTGDFARLRSAQGRGDADRLGDLAAWLYGRIPARSGPVLSRGVIVPVAAGGLPVFWLMDPSHPLHGPQHGDGLPATEIAALYEDLGAEALLQHLRA